MTKKYNASKIAHLALLFKAGYESAQAIISQGEAENKVIVDYDEKLKYFYINDNQLSLDKRYKAMLDASPPTNTDGY